MHDHGSYRVHLCASVLFIVLFVAHATWRFRLFSVHDYPLEDHKPNRSTDGPAPALIDLKPICSFDLFRNIASSRADGFVSGNGNWVRSSKGVPEYFQPNVCRFRHKIHIPRPEAVQCIRQHRLRYVVFAGDSNTLRYFIAFRAFLRSGIGADCLSVQVSIFILHISVIMLYHHMKLVYQELSRPSMIHRMSPVGYRSLHRLKETQTLHFLTVTFTN